MKVGFIGDLHFSHKNFKEASQALSVVIDALINERVDFVVQLGDCWDYYNISSGQTSVATIVSSLKDQFLKLQAANIPTYIIEGNHDQSIRGHQGEYYRSSVCLLEDRLIHPITEPQIITVQPNVSLLTLPWKTNYNIIELAKNYNKTNKSDFKILAGHFLLEGSRQHSYELTDGEFFLTKNDLKTIHYNIVAAGHVHHRQSVYVGIVIQNSLADAGFPTGCRIVEFDPVTKKIIVDKFINTKAPQYKLIEVANNDLASIKRAIKKTNDYDKFVIRINGIKQFNLVCPPNVKLEFKPDPKAIIRLEKDGIEIEQMTTGEMFALWAQKNGHQEELIQKALIKLKEHGIT